jgi:hypothetical protein
MTDSQTTILASAPLPSSDFILDFEAANDSSKDSQFKHLQYFGTIQRFFQSEVKPIYFGKPRRDFVYSRTELT